ncbi:MAG: hypothetical protein M4D85_09725 [Actinomycetota bacterium]|nr:hypothetical protein [Actinomycetota bacterium]
MDPATAPAQPTWRDLLRVQDQVIARRQALRGGMSAAAWDWRFTSRRWQLVLPGVAVAHTGTVTWEQRA